MTLQELTAFLEAQLKTEENRIRPAVGISDAWLGAEIYDVPLIGAAAAEDPLFTEYKKPGVVGPWFRTPAEWLPGAGTVVSFFLPFSGDVRRSNRAARDMPGEAWLYARIEGQAFMDELCRRLGAQVEALGHAAVFPSLSREFSQVKNPAENLFSSNWSERHAAYACGLGTFGLSKGLITEKGIAGRFASFITDAVIAPTPRNYSGIYDYCTNCGKCAANCPAGAISLAEGKLHTPCAAYLQVVGKTAAPRYGCGKCQVDVPCEAARPFFPGKNR